MAFRDRSRLKSSSLVGVIVLVAAACGSSDPVPADTPDPTGAPTPQSTESPEEELSTPPEATPPEAAPDAAQPGVDVTTISLPDGLRHWWESNNRSAPFAGDAFMLAASSDVETGGESPNLKVLRINAALEWTTVNISIPAVTTSADLFVTGSRLAVSYLDPAGEIVFLTSTDGTTFEEARMPLPERYVTADTWAGTSLVGNVAGAADLGGEVFAIVNAAVLWRRPLEIAQENAAGQEPDPEKADAIRLANTIRSEPLDDGDTLFTFVKGDVEVEVLGSETGIENGYVDAYDDRESGTFEVQSWMIDGSNSRNLDTPPFGGQEGIRLHALYPVESGVGAVVTDFNIAPDGADAFGEPGIYASGTAAALGLYSTWDLRTLITLDGLLWFAQALVGATNPFFGSLAWSLYGGVPLWILVFYSDEGTGVATSQDGSSWGVPDYTTDLSVGGGVTVQIDVTGDQTIRTYSFPDGSYRQYRVEYPNGPDGDALLELIFESDVAEPEETEVGVTFYRDLRQSAAKKAEAQRSLTSDVILPPRPTGN